MNLGITRLLRPYLRSTRSTGMPSAQELVARSGTEASGERLRFYREGRLANVAVLDVGERTVERTVLVVNGKPDAMVGAGGDMMQQVFLGHAPMLLAREAQDVCIVGYGSGVTTHAVLCHPVREVLTVELEEAVIEAAPFFKAGAFSPLEDPRSRLIIEDAGTYLRSAGRSYDVIINEPTNPWIAGVGDLFTREFYAEAAARLKPGGIFCQWIQAYETSAATLDTILRTLTTHFPRGHLFYIRPSFDLIIVASPERDREMALDVDLLQAAFGRPEVAADLARVGILSTLDLLRLYRGRLETAAARAGPGPINTDDNGWLEHRAPLDLIRPATYLKGDPIPWSAGVGEDLAASLGPTPERAAEVLNQAVDRAVEIAATTRLDNPALSKSVLEAGGGLVTALEALRRPEAEAARRRVATAEVLREAVPSLLRAEQSGDKEMAGILAEKLEGAAAMDPSSWDAVWNLGSARMTAGRIDSALETLRRALELAPESARFPIQLDLALAEFRRGALAESLRELEALERLKPGSAEAYLARTHIFLAQGNAARAREELERGLAQHPKNAKLLELKAKPPQEVPPAAEPAGGRRPLTP